MATPKKKHLIELMIEANVQWPDGANYAAQDKDGPRIHFYRKKPIRGGNTYWSSSERIAYSGVILQSLCCNWHQTIVTREQYEQALSNAAVTTEVQTEYEHCEPVVSQGTYTINQLADDYYAKAAKAERLQSIADEALKLANEALATLKKAGEHIGLVISVNPKPEQPVITDWRDLRVGDVVEHIEDNGGGLLIGSIGKINKVCEKYIKVDYENWTRYSYGVPYDLHKFKFIRRP